MGVGPGATDVLASWRDELTRRAGRPSPLVLCADDVGTACEQLAAALAEARVGVRVRVAGSVGSCLTLRATAIAAGLEDDELYVAPTGSGPVEVACVHCGGVASAEAAIGDVVGCPGCGRDLLVYYHVSRRLGRFLGFQGDAGAIAE
ncbi:MULTISPECIES: dimethylamine monooxygenase subunit DmmA family protein [unclassified Pseudofrankia]|uniref:dimethylamine monooxygenase subunit DmmA family protein n=1 Tax=unclassified Pseudofrankia TaxID=2994372 RepID=UPI001F516F3D|nr:MULTISPECIES: dimethylamine monooxygenase subunit DmmA family protein [unclassified Pseudofrankia]MDT3444425.1 dimethylamine monooxygenase subunit DmmA family protein [Pseudofrankia sp. BMG5.37]